MIEYQTYTINFDPKDLIIALNNTDKPFFLDPYFGDIYAFGQPVANNDWESGINQIMEEYDEAWRYLARL